MSLNTSVPRQSVRIPPVLADQVFLTNSRARPRTPTFTVLRKPPPRCWRFQPPFTSGKETITADSPVRLPEARHGIASGKLPRKTGLLLVRDGIQHEFVLQAETLAVSGARTQLSGNGDAVGGLDAAERIEALRHLSETIDLLFGAFCKRRLSSGWPRELDQIRLWLRKQPGDSRKTAA